MKPKHLIVGAVMTAFSLLALAAPESASAGAAATSAPASAPKAAKAKSAKKSEQGKTRGLKSKKGKECVTDAGCESGNRK